MSKLTHEEVVKENQEIAEKILSSPEKYMREGTTKLDYRKIRTEFDLGINRCYMVMFAVQQKLRKRARKS